MTKLKPCTAVMEPQAEFEERGQGNTMVYSKPKLPYHVLQRAVADQELQYKHLQRAYQKAQVQVIESSATAEKALRVIRKGTRRSREITSHKRLLETKHDRLAREADIPQLRVTLAGTEENCWRAQEEARIYKNKYKLSLEELEQEAKLKRQALAQKEEALREVEELELQRQQELQRYQEAVNTAGVFGQFLYELCVKAIFLPSMKASNQAQQTSSTAANTRTARFL